MVEEINLLTDDHLIYLVEKHSTLGLLMIILKEDHHDYVLDSKTLAKIMQIRSM